jgi:hypothetical protein
MADDPNNTKAAFDKNWASATEAGEYVTQTHEGAWVLAPTIIREALLGGCPAVLELDQGGQKNYAFPPDPTSNPTSSFWFLPDRLRWVNALNPSMRREDFFDRPWPWELRAYLSPSESWEIRDIEGRPIAREQIRSTLRVFLHRAEAIQWKLLPSPLRVEPAGQPKERRSTLPKKRRGTRGPLPETTDRIARELKDGIQKGRYTIQDGRLFERPRLAARKKLRPISQENLMAAHKCGKSTLLEALSIVLSELKTPTETPTETPTATETPTKK